MTIECYITGTLDGGSPVVIQGPYENAALRLQVNGTVIGTICGDLFVQTLDSSGSVVIPTYVQERVDAVASLIGAWVQSGTGTLGVGAREGLVGGHTLEQVTFISQPNETMKISTGGTVIGTIIGTLQAMAVDTSATITVHDVVDERLRAVERAVGYLVADYKDQTPETDKRVSAGEDFGFAAQLARRRSAVMEMLTAKLLAFMHSKGFGTQVMAKALCCSKGKAYSLVLRGYELNGDPRAKLGHSRYSAKHNPGKAERQLQFVTVCLDRLHAKCVEVPLETIDPLEVDIQSLMQAPTSPIPEWNETGD